MSASNRYGQIVTPGMVERAFVATLELWMDDYLGELERVEGYDVGEVVRPAGIITASQFAKWPEDQLPLIMVIAPGTTGKPERHAQGRYNVAWAVTAAAIVSDIDELEARRLAGAYAGAMRAAILQHKMLKSPLHPEGFAQFLSWKGEGYGDLGFEDARTLDSCRVEFAVGVEDVTTEHAGPRTPSGSPGTDPGPLPILPEDGVRVTVGLTR